MAEMLDATGSVAYDSVALIRLSSIRAVIITQSGARSGRMPTDRSTRLTLNSIAPAQSVVDQTIYLRNMARLWRIDPQLAIRIDAVADTARVAVEASRSGEPTAAMSTPDGKRIYLHSRYQPIDEARRLAESVDVGGQYCFIVAGFGLGHHIRALFDRLAADSVLIVCEPSLPMLAAAFASVDLADMLAGGRLVILTDANKNTIHHRLRPHTALMMMGAKFVTHPSSHRVAPRFHAEMRQVITDFVAYSRTTIMTLVQNARITCRNVANNLVHMVTTPPIDAMRNRFRGQPAIVVSAGPSLRKNIDQLVGLENRAVICAVQTTLKPLLNRGIRPHFVTSLDFHEISARYFDGLTDLEDVRLIVEPKVTWHVTDHYPGPMSLTDNDFARLLLGDQLIARDALPAGATVAHLAFYLAQYLGCDPIIFIGQDLAFTGHVFYVPGVEAHRDWDSELNRFCPLETKEWERIARNRQILRKVAGVDGRPIYTDELLFTYLEQFEKDISICDAHVINATEGGAHIRGAESMPLADAIDRFCTNSIAADSPADQDDRRATQRDRLVAAHNELGRRIAEVESMRSVCAELVDLLNRLTELVHDPPRFNQMIVRVDELRARVNQSNRAYRVISAAAQLAELRRFSADRRLAATVGEETDRAIQQLKRDIQYVGDVREGATQMLDILDEAKSRIENAIEQQPASSILPAGATPT